MFPYDDDAEAYFLAHSDICHGLLVTSEGSVEKAYKYFADFLEIRFKLIPSIFMILT